MKSLAILIFISLAIMTTCGCEFEDDKPDVCPKYIKGVCAR